MGRSKQTKEYDGVPEINRYIVIELDWRQYKTDVLGNLTQEIKNTLYAGKTFGKEEIDHAYYQQGTLKSGNYQIEYVMMPILWEGETHKDEAQDKYVREIMESFAFDVQKGSLQVWQRSMI